MKTNIASALALFALLGLSHAISLEAGNLSSLAEVSSIAKEGQPTFNFDSQDDETLPPAEATLSVDKPESRGPGDDCKCRACKRCDVTECLKFNDKCPEPNVTDADFETCKDCDNKHKCFNTKYEDSFCLSGASQTKLPKADIVNEQITNSFGETDTRQKTCGCGKIKKEFCIKGNITVTEDICKNICDGNHVKSDGAFNKTTKTRQCTEGKESECKDLCDCHKVCRRRGPGDSVAPGAEPEFDSDDEESNGPSAVPA